MGAGVGRFQVRVYEKESPSAARFKAVADIEMDSIQASEVNRALGAAKADVRFVPMDQLKEK